MNNNNASFIEIVRGWESMELNFGVVPAGSELPYRFVFRKGADDAQFEIHCYGASCSCTGGKLQKNREMQTVEGTWVLPKAEHLFRESETQEFIDQVQTIDIFFNPQERFWSIDNNGKRFQNQNKLTIQLKMMARIDAKNLTLRNAIRPAQVQQVPPNAANVAGGQVIRQEVRQVHVIGDQPQITKG